VFAERRLRLTALILACAGACAPLDGGAAADGAARPDTLEEAPREVPLGGEFVDLERELHRQVNRHRGRERLPTMVWDEAVAEAARGHSRDMAAGRVPFSHAGFERRAAELRRELGGWEAIAENLAMNDYPRDSSAVRAFWGLLGSPQHRRNLEGRFTRTGVGVARGRGGDWFYTQIYVR
jgi:uncharacterized protein YkwD